MNRRRRWFDRVIDGQVPQLLQAGETAAAHAAFATALEAVDSVPARGSVQWVGAGPGDPGLLTLNALRALNLADVLLLASDVPAAVVELARRDAQRQPWPATPADQQATLLELIGAGLHVVILRLGSGDAIPAALAAALHAQGAVSARVPGLPVP